MKIFFSFIFDSNDSKYGLKHIRFSDFHRKINEIIIYKKDDIKLSIKRTSNIHLYLTFLIS